jgi:hypothetical protein
MRSARLEINSSSTNGPERGALHKRPLTWGDSAGVHVELSFLNS